MRHALDSIQELKSEHANLTRVTYRKQIGKIAKALDSWAGAENLNSFRSTKEPMDARVLSSLEDVASREEVNFPQLPSRMRDKSIPSKFTSRNLSIKSYKHRLEVTSPHNDSKAEKRYKFKSKSVRPELQDEVNQYNAAQDALETITETVGLHQSPSLSQILSRANLHLHKNFDSTVSITHDRVPHLHKSPPAVKVTKQKQDNRKIERIIEILKPDSLKVRFEDALKSKLTPLIQTPDPFAVPPEIMEKYGAMSVEQYQQKKNE